MQIIHEQSVLFCIIDDTEVAHARAYTHTCVWAHGRALTINWTPHAAQYTLQTSHSTQCTDVHCFCSHPKWQMMIDMTNLFCVLFYCFTGETRVEQAR